MKRIVVIGGGTGSFTVLSGLKKLTDIHLTAVVPSSDSGGSTGRLRDEFGYLPIGDIRQCLVALAESDEEQHLLRELFSYRFDKGEIGLKGHNFGNLFLTALRDILGNELEAIRTVQKLLNIKGNVYPVSLKETTLVAEYENGMIVHGEHHIDEPAYPHDGRMRITKLSVEPQLASYPEVYDAIRNADCILIAPGDLYTSLLANFVIEGISSEVQNSKAKLVYVLNLVTKFGQTHGFTAKDFVNEIKRYVGKFPDHILVNNTPMPEHILEKYRLENAFPVVNNLTSEYNVIEDDLLADEEIITPSGDVLKRSLIRHDPSKVAKLIGRII